MKYIIKILFVMLLLCMTIGCKGNEEKEPYKDKSIDIFYLNRSETTIRAEKYRIKSTTVENAVEEVLAQMKKEPEKAELKASPFAEIPIHSIRFEETKLFIDLGEKYKGVSQTTEILMRAAIVKTLTQIEGIDYVSIEVEGMPLLDINGVIVGLLSKEQFIDNPEGQISNNVQTNLTLYFANAEGTALIPVQRYVEYNTNISQEKLVTELLIQGPLAGEEGYPVLNPSTKIISVIVKDRICYLNLDESFLTQIYSVNSDVTIYALANSLINLNNVNKVQISVNGKTELTYMESISLTNYFERNLDLVEIKEEGITDTGM